MQTKKILINLTEEEYKKLMDLYVEYLKKEPLSSRVAWIKKLLGVV